MTGLLFGNWLEVNHIDRCLLILYILEKEVKLALAYLGAVLFYRLPQLINAHYTVTYFKFVRWSMEAMLMPYSVFICFIFYYAGPYDMVLELCMRSYPIMLMSKAPLFIVMRYAENHLDCSVNNFQLLILEIYCNFFSNELLSEQ